MSEGMLYFILGLVASIPVSVFSPFLTDRIKQNYSVRKQGPVGLRRRKTIEAELAEVSRMHSSPGSFSVFLLWRILKITLVSSVVALLPNAFYAVSSVMTALSYDDLLGTANSLAPLASWVNAAASIAGILGTAIVVQLCVQTLRVYDRVKNFDSYREKVRQQLGWLPQSREAPQQGRAQGVGAPTVRLHPDDARRSR